MTRMTPQATSPAASRRPAAVGRRVPTIATERDAFYAKIDGDNLTALWTVSSRGIRLLPVRSSPLWIDADR